MSILPAMFPSSAAMVDLRSGQGWTGHDIEAEARARGNILLRNGVARGDRCVIAPAGAADALLWMFAAWETGLTAIVVNPAITTVERANIVARARPSVWIGSDGPEVLLSRRSAHRQAPRPSDPDDPALVLMTSGTTGVPKGIVHTLRSLHARIALNLAAIGPAPLTETLCVLPVFFGHGLIGNCLTPLAAGGRLHLWTSPTAAELVDFATRLSDQSITFMSSVPAFWKLAMRMSAPPQRPPRRIHVGSSPLSLPQWEAIAGWSGTGDVWNMFGMTETANWIGGAPLSEARGRDGYVGRPWGGRIAVLDGDGQVRDRGRGEAVVLSPSIMSGYLDQPDPTRAAFAGPWFRTGDIGEIDDDGGLTLVGRIKFEINRAGIKIQAEEIDMMLERHPDVAEACAFGLPDPASGEAVAAAVVPIAGRHLDVAALRSWCRSQVRAEAVPVRLFVVPDIPRNERGKVLRDQVRALVAGPGSTG
ncbi:class I adenylate-forming enzyme family protein [Phreatobacter sp.]|uniref:class I adenylate-forming enzyme family protein n=1 Tax=Phreatobacter sp. TaxID=1966341 RepID=UPI0022BE992F|nr:class I adenylate-forming enzyme family protein [Phreatobacter sp.]MCZ8315713.1 class I adenylate-forming enzyme family protein [Phreatobacter sp.]